VGVPLVQSSKGPMEEQEFLNFLLLFWDSIAKQELPKAFSSDRKRGPEQLENFWGRAHILYVDSLLLFEDTP